MPKTLHIINHLALRRSSKTSYGHVFIRIEAGHLLVWNLCKVVPPPHGQFLLQQQVFLGFFDLL